MHVLIADNHLLFGEAMKMLLVAHYPAVRTTLCGDFKEVALIVPEKVGIDLVLTELRLPGQRGFDSLGGFTRRFPRVPVIVVSSSRNPQDMRLAFDRGARGYAHKSLDPRIFLSGVDLVLNGGLFVPPELLQLQKGELSQQVSVPSFLNPKDEKVRRLTPRQIDVLFRLRQGMANKEIGWELGMAESTVKIHATAIFKTLGVRSRTQAVIESNAFLTDAAD